MKPVVVERMMGPRDHAVLAGVCFLGLGVGVGAVLQIPRLLGRGELSEVLSLLAATGVAFLTPALGYFLVGPVGRCELREDGIGFGRAVVTPWSEIGTFDDGSADFIRVRARSGRWLLPIPTPDDATRRAVLEVLEMRIPRGDAR